ncbi:MAG: S8 family peptidase [Niameybacter sp.]|uniref:S8 family peptidase n=1 Tax=Niameybacter sp. TaxID=2033640 RepID=UPI002FCB3DB7
MAEYKDYLIETPIRLEEYKKLYPSLIFAPISSRLIIVSVPEGAELEFEGLEKSVGSIYLPILLGLNAIDAIEQSNISTFHTYPFGELRGTGVLIGFVDTGIQYTNPLFTYEDNTTRIINIWDQSIEGSGGPEYDYGTIYTEEQINEALKSKDPLSVVPSTDENGHGTMLAAIAAGNERGVPGGYVGGAPDATLAVVKLKPAKQYLRDLYLIKDGAVAYQDDDYLTGINYLLTLAKEQDKPIVICTALGSNQGGHEGDTVSERYLQESSTFENVIFVVSAGNEVNQGHHYSGKVLQGGTSLFEVNVGADEKGFIMYLWATAPDKLTVSVKTPLGGNTGKIPSNNIRVQEYTFPLENVKLEVQYIASDVTSGDQSIRFRLTTPTPGIWTITVYGESVVSGEYNVWLPRAGFVGKDTRFLQPDVGMTITTPGNAYETIVMGAYNGMDQSIYAGSSRGPTRNMVTLPSLVAPGVNVLAPNLSGGYSRYSGTGVATAVTTSACALLLEWAVIKNNLFPINTRIAKTVLIRGARRSPNQTYPNNIEGYGKLDFQNSLILV